MKEGLNFKRGERVREARGLTLARRGPTKKYQLSRNQGRKQQPAREKDIKLYLDNRKTIDSRGKKRQPGGGEAFNKEERPPFSS